MLIKQNEKDRYLRFKQPSLNPQNKAREPIINNPEIINLWLRMLQEHGEIEIIQQNVTKIKVNKHADVKDKAMNEDLFIHILLEDSHEIAKKMESIYEIDYNEAYNLDGILKKYKDDNENSADLINNIRERM